MRSDSVLFDKSVAAGGTEYLSKTLYSRGRVKRMTITNYPGQQKTLEVKPYLNKAPDLYTSLAKFVGDRPFFSGDETTYNIALNIEFGPGDRLHVDVTNTGDFAYDLYVLFEIEYGG